MMRKRIKIGFSDIGGIYIGKEIQTDEHLHHAITVAVALSGKFDYWHKKEQVSCSGIIMQANTIRKIINQDKTQIAFIHIEPFSKQGLKLTNRNEPFEVLTPVQIKNIINILGKWSLEDVNDEQMTANIIEVITSEIGYTSEIEIDKRIVKSIDIIRRSEEITLKQISEQIHLSTYRFSHLFKQQTGLSFREFVLYTKLVKSLKAVYQNQNFTHSSYLGGFADQAHFTRTYYRAFGILPSQSVR